MFVGVKRRSLSQEADLLFSSKTFESGISPTEQSSSFDFDVFKLSVILVCSFLHLF